MISGPELFCLYAQPPNQAGYCGPEDTDVVEASVAGVDVPRDELLRVALAFHGAFPYLELIAGLAGRDPLDRDVVEAYWIGGPLVEAVDLQRWGNSLAERFARRSGRDWDAVVAGLNGGGKPNHTFHVFLIYPWVGLLRAGNVGPALGVLDRCRISWGRVEELSAGSAVVSRRPLAWSGRALVEGGLSRELYRVPAALALECGDTVSLHWDAVCQRLDGGRLTRLRASHDRHLALANRELHTRRLEPV